MRARCEPARPAVFADVIGIAAWKALERGLREQVPLPAPEECGRLVDRNVGGNTG